MKETRVDLTVIFFASVVALIGGSAFYRFVENWSWLDSIYFSIITLTTVGYGDLAPTSPLSKVFTMFYVLIGIGIIFGLIHAISRRGLKAALHRRVIESKDKKK